MQPCDTAVNKPFIIEKAKREEMYELSYKLEIRPYPKFDTF